MSSSGEPGPNLHQAASAAADLIKARCGFFPIIPHTTWILHAIRPDISVDDWKAWDRFWVSKSDAVLRLPGSSEGADSEVRLAKQLGIPVFYSVEEIIKVYQGVRAYGLKP